MLSMILIISVLLGVLLFRANKNTKKVAANTVKISHSKINKKILKILHLSDLHLENISISADDLYKMIAHEKIDLIALTGDFLDRKRSIPKLTAYLQVLKKINPTYGIFAVFGNHDYILKGQNFDTLKRTLEENGCTTLQNEHVSIKVDGRNLNIIGIDDYCTNRSDVQKAFHGLEEGYNLVLTHDPNVVLEMKNVPFDYLLSGHFHGGQIHWPKPYHLAVKGKLAKMNMIKGLHFLNGKPFYISEGLGQTGINIRIGSRPEITFHEIF